MASIPMISACKPLTTTLNVAISIPHRHAAALDFSVGNLKDEAFIF